MNEILHNYFKDHPEKYIPIARVIGNSKRIQMERDEKFRKRREELECLTSIRQMVSQKT